MKKCFIGILIFVLSISAHATSLRKMQIQDADTGKTAAVETNGGLAVNIQDQHSRAFDVPFLLVLNAPTTISVATAVEDKTITVTDTTGFVDGVTVGLSDAFGNFYFGHQIGAPVGNVITVDVPVDTVYAIGSSIFPATDNMNVDGSVTTQVFQVGPVGGGFDIDITRIMGYIQDGTSMDDGKFGGITALTYGILLRRNDGVITNYWHAKSNGEIALVCFDAQYTDKAPGGSFGYRFRNTYAGPSKHGVTIRLEAGDTLELLIQDDLTGLEIFNMMAQGHFVTD